MATSISEINVEKLVDEVIVARTKQNVRDYSYFHSSEWHKCHRRTVYEYYKSQGHITVDVPLPVVNTGLQKIFDNGHYLHDRCRAYLEGTSSLKGWWVCVNFSKHPDRAKVYGENEKLGIHRPSECECGCKKFGYREVRFLCEETNWGGSVDAIIDCSSYISGVLPVEDTHLIIDFKSINMFQFAKLIGPKPEHYSQMQIYFYLSGLKYGKFVYENKNTQEWTEFLVVRDDEWIAKESYKAKELKYITQTLNAKGQRVLPPRPYAEMADECLECSFSKLCWK